MIHLGTQILETERLILRRFTLDDAQAMYENWAGDPEVTKYLMWPPHSSVEVSRGVLADWVGHYAEDDFYQWAITLRADGNAPVGGISVVSKNDRIAMVHIGYCIGRAWWRQGITSEALAAIIQFFFERVGVNRIESRHDANNPHSGRVMAKCGMTCEGTMREADWNNQGICDAVRYAILRGEYEKV